MKKILIFLLLLSGMVNAQTKTTIASLKGSPSKTFKGVYYVLSGKDTLYYKRVADNYSGDLLLSKNGQKFSQLITEAKPSESANYSNATQSYTATCGEGFTGSNTAVIIAGTYTSTISVVDANNKALAAATQQAKTGLKCIANPPPSTGTVIDISKIPDGKYAENALHPSLYNAAGVKTGSGFTADKPDVLLLATREAAYNMEVETYMPCDRIYLRKQADGKAIMFSYKAGSDPAWGRFMAGISNEENAVYPAGGNTNLNEHLNIKLEGWPNGKFTFGVDGFDYYAKWNGKEFFREKQYNIIAPGTVAIYSTEGMKWIDGFKVTLKADKVETGVIDAKAMGFKSEPTTGSIKGGSTELFVKDLSKFEVNDLGFIATGGEADFNGLKGGSLGTPGVGVTSWPGKGYATKEELDKANPNQKYSWTHDNGLVYEKYETGWFPKFHPIDYYIKKAVPAGHRFRVVKKLTDRLIIDVAANVSTTDAEVWFDNEELFNRAFGTNNGVDIAGMTVRFPKERFMFGEYISITGRSNFTLEVNETVFVAPRGSAQLNFNVIFCPNFRLKGKLIVQSNVEEDGWGFRWFPRRGGGNLIAPVDVNNAGDYEGGFGIGHSDGSVLDAVEVRNTFSHGPVVGVTKNVVYKKVSYIHTTGVHKYSGWAINSTDGAENCTYENIYFESPKIMRGIEAFGGKNNAFKNIVAVNCNLSSNTSMGMRIENYNLRYTKNSLPDFLMGVLSDPCINFNGNTGRPDEKGGAVLRNGKVIFEDFLDEQGDYKAVVNVQAGVNDVVIDGLEVIYAKPFSTAKGATAGCQAVVATGINTTVNNVICHGENAPHHPMYSSNIAVQDGTVTNCDVTTLCVMKGKIKGNKAKKIFITHDVLNEGGNTGEIVYID